MISRDEAVQLLTKFLKGNKEVYKKSLAVENIMKKISETLEKDTLLWRLTGLLHDLDYEYTYNTPENHTELSSKILDGLVPKKAIHAIQSHNYIHSEVIPIRTLDKALLASDAACELIFASMNQKKKNTIASITIKDIMKRYQNKKYDNTYHKEWILLCTDFNMDLKTFLQLSLKAIKEIDQQINAI